MWVWKPAFAAANVWPVVESRKIVLTAEDPGKPVEQPEFLAGSRRDDLRPDRERTTMGRSHP